ncbi:phage tail assembly chaperone [Paracoccus sp. KR1-242]|uniref:phage tail assembly chaperone n=1 Tax=Paracoccus sp. KR1-242 TaxID=3410028 RepID=UPI003C0FC588
MDRLTKQLCAAVKAALAGQKVAPPEAGRAIWNAFHSLSGTRTYNPAGPNPIQPSEMAAWCQLMRLPLEPRHVAALLAMDVAWLDHAYSRTKAPDGVNVLPPISKMPLTTALLDAMLG